ncbi:MAG TPA: zf-HC2 domain-containing protein [Ktedonobacteraceae bacterium]|nr:zf-HC2 domain-containing protein [Ktedonobacteraceae bacterium]
MQCAKADQQLQLYLDKRLTIKQVRSLEAHVATCSACQQSLYWLEMVAQDLRYVVMVPEPPDLTSVIMQRVALAPRQREVDYTLLRPSLHEFLVMIVLSTIVMLGVILGQPSLRAVLPVVNGHDVLSQIFLSMAHLFIDVNSGMLMWIFWIVGTLLGVWITLALAGAEMRTEWLKAMMDRLPVW